MTDEPVNPLEQIAQELKAIRVSLHAIAMAAKCYAGNNPPDWKYPLQDYSGFNWGEIGATVLQKDAWGAVLVRWGGHIYTRRAGEKKNYGAALWFSRPRGGEGDNATYVRLITFKSGSVAEPLPDYVIRELKSPK